MKHLEEKFVSRKEIFDGHVLHVVCDTIELPNGKEATREICLHNGAVAVIPVLPDGRVVNLTSLLYSKNFTVYTTSL